MFERLINRDLKIHALDLIVMPGTLEDKHKNCDSIPALRRQFNLIYLLLDGEHDVKLGAEQLQLSPNDLVIVPENTLYASDHIKNCKGYCIHFKTEFLQSFLSKPLADEFPFFRFDAPHILNLSENESLIIQKAFKDILAEHERASTEKDSLLCNLVMILLLRIREIYRSHAQALQKSSTRREHLANKFRLLVEKNFISFRSVGEYADLLNISTRYLTEVVSETFGRSPLQIIHDLLLLEAKVQLRSTSKSISEIAFYLKFDDQPHFTNFIKRRTGTSPQALRQKL